MSTKLHCDICKEIIDDKNNLIWKDALNIQYKIEITINRIDICRKCLFKLLKRDWKL